MRGAQLLSFLSNQTTLSLSFDMKKNIILCIISAIVGIIAGFVVCQNTMHTKYNNLLNAYDSYNKATEDLLDTLDNKYNWVDAFDPCDYYDSRAKLDSILWKESK